MSSQSKLVTVPPMELNLDQFLNLIRKLDRPTRIQVARGLAETEMDAELGELIEQPARSSPADDISEADIQTEVSAVRGESK